MHVKFIAAVHGLACYVSGRSFSQMLRANASKHKAMSYERMVKTEDELAAEVASWLDKATEVDAMEDAEHGPDRRGDEMPDWMANKQQRLDRIRAARAALEAEAKAAAAAKEAVRLGIVVHAFFECQH